MLVIALVSDQRMRALHRRFRGQSHATDVLSFPAAAGPWAIGEPPFLGEVAIALGVAARQAKRLGHATTTEVRTLALHGLLHLLGYDHERDDGHMSRVEERLRRRAGLPAGLIGRASARRRP
jgi:probable rRNA maturation factor